MKYRSILEKFLFDKNVLRIPKCIERSSQNYLGGILKKSNAFACRMTIKP